MEAAVDRRIFQPRISLDALVELSQSSGAGFSAEALDVGLGGMSMRAPHLPDVGSDVLCRFRTKGGADVETAATVVWAKESGAAKEFGLRFHRLEGDTQRHLRRLVTGSYVPPSPAAVYRPKAPKDVLPIDEVPKERVAEREVGRKVRLQLEGIDRSLTARLRHEGSARMELEQELPFLRLKTGLTLEEDGRCGRIESVDLLIEDDIPRLLIDVSYVESWVGEDSPSPTEVEQLAPCDESTLPDTPRAEMISESTLAGFPPTLAPDIDVPELDEMPAPKQLTVRKPVSKALTVRGYGQTVKSVAKEEIASSPTPRVVEARTSKAPEKAAEPAPVAITAPLAAAAEPMPAARAPAELVQSDSPRAAESADASDSATAVEVADLCSKDDAVDLKLGGIQAVLGQGITKVRTGAKAIATTVGPKASLALGAVRKHTARLRVLAKPFLLTVWARLSVAFGVVTTFLRARGIAGFKKLSTRRRRTSPAPRESNVAPSAARKSRAGSRKSKVAPRQRRKIGRWVLAAVLIVLALVLGKMAFFGDDTAAAEAPELGSEASAVDSEPTNRIAPVAASITAPSQPSQPVAVQLPQAVELPSSATNGLGEPSREAGPMAAPTFPSIGERTRPQAQGTTPPSSPYAGNPEVVPTAENVTPVAHPAAGGQVFGAQSVANPESFTLRMSRPVGEIRGAVLTDGFTVTIPDSLSLDRAGPIAHSHPLVDRAMILNLGDHSVLTVHFVQGRSPDYRVVVRNNAIEVVIGR